MQWTRRDVLFATGVLAGGAAGGLLRARRPPTAVLRPPGAMAEARFLAACSRCGQCVKACPYRTLRLIRGLARARLATPTFDPRKIPCSLCQGYDELRCIAACPTGALAPVPSERAVRIGTAEILLDLCLAYNEVICRSCWHACPFPNEAIRFDERLRPVVDEDHCVGCGLCTRACPTEITSIPVRPREL